MLSSKGGETSDNRSTGNERNERSAAQSRREPVATSVGAGRNAPTAGEFDEFPAALQDEDDDLPF